MFSTLPLLTKGVLFGALALFVVGAFLVVFIPVARSLKAQLSTSSIVNIESAMIGQDDVTSYLALRAKELGRGVHLDALYEIRVPPLAENFGSGDKFKLPEDLKFEIQGVNVPGVVTSILKVLPDDRYLVKVESVKGASDAVRVEWRAPNGSTQTWLLRPEKDDAKDVASTRMADRVIATVLYYIYYDREGPKELRRAPNLRPASNDAVFPNARALEAYFVGQQYLNAYLLNNEESAPLDNAEMEFRRLQIEMPEFVDGLMLLGVTLSEKRDEANAIVAYRRAKELLRERFRALESEIVELDRKANAIFNLEEREEVLRQVAATKAARIAAQKTFFQAQLFQASAYRKLYTWDNLVLAISELDDIESGLTVLKNRPLPGMSAQDSLEFEKIGAVALAEKANSLGYGLILLYPETFVDALKELISPRTLAVSKDRRDRLAQLAVDLAGPNPDRTVIDRRNAEFRSELGLLASEQSKLLGVARKAVRDIAMPTGASGEDQKAWEREKKRIESLLLSAEGYALFREAQLEKPNTRKGNEEFIAVCRKALERLHEADAKQPGQYVVLLNLGMIYGEPRYDVRNERIGVARRYFERANQIKPNDYFGHQSLAVLAVRQGYAWGFDLAEEPFKSTAASHATDSLKLRPGNGTVFVAQAQLAALSWAAADEAANQKKWEAAFNAALANARNVRANPVRILVASLQWRLIQLRAASTDPAPPATSTKGMFTFEKEAFATELKEADEKASKVPGWEADQLRLAIADFRSKIDALTFDKRDTLIWPPKPLPVN